MGSLMLLLLRLLKKMYDLIIMHFRKPSGHIVVHAQGTVYRLKMNERLRKKKKLLQHYLLCVDDVMIASVLLHSVQKMNV